MRTRFGGEGWKDNDGWSGRRGRWLRDRLATMIAAACTEEKGWSKELRLRVLLLMLESPESFSYRAPTPEYLGKRYNAWTWHIDEKAVAQAIERIACEELAKRNKIRAAQQEAERYPTLEAWLSALHEKRLWVEPVQERSGASLVGRSGFERQQREREGRWPRMCRQCGGEFTWNEVGRRNAVRCSNCLPKRESRRQRG